MHLELPTARGGSVSRSVASDRGAVSCTRKMHSKVFSRTPPAACSASHVFCTCAGDEDGRCSRRQLLNFRPLLVSLRAREGSKKGFA